MFDVDPTAELIGAGIAGVLFGWLSFAIGQSIRQRLRNWRNPPTPWQRDRLSPELRDLPNAGEDDRAAIDLREENVRLRLDAQVATESLQAAEHRNQATMQRMADNQLLVQRNEQAMDRVRLELGEVREIVAEQLGLAGQGREPESAPTTRLQTSAPQTDRLIDLTESLNEPAEADTEPWAAGTPSEERQFEKQWSTIEQSWDEPDHT